MVRASTDEIIRSAVGMKDVNSKLIDLFIDTGRK